MRPTTILVIDDEPQIRRVVRNALGGKGVTVLEAAGAHEGVDIAAAEQPSLIILDLGLPDRDGLDVCRDLRAFTDAPIIVLSARDDEVDKVSLLDNGADDYLTKPFSPAELQARVRAHSRRHSKESKSLDGGRAVFRDLTVDLVKRTVSRGGRAIHLTPTEWTLLKTFVTHPDRPLTHRQLFLAVWGNVEGDAQQYLRVYVGQLRRKIEDDPVRPTFIKTEPSIGYRFEGGGRREHEGGGSGDSS